MDPSIMKLLEEDEDESMHSGADVEALSAALNRDIGGDPAALARPPESDTGVSMLGSSSASKQVLGQWQTSSEVENEQQIQQKEQKRHLQSSEQHSSGGELIQAGSVSQPQDEQINNQPRHDCPTIQQEASHSDDLQRQPEANLLEKEQHSENQQQHLTQQSNSQQIASANIANMAVQHSENQQQHLTQQSNSQQIASANIANMAVQHSENQQQHLTQQSNSQQIASANIANMAVQHSENQQQHLTQQSNSQQIASANIANMAVQHSENQQQHLTQQSNSQQIASANIANMAVQHSENQQQHLTQQSNSQQIASANIANMAVQHSENQQQHLTQQSNSQQIASANIANMAVQHSENQQQHIVQQSNSQQIASANIANMAVQHSENQQQHLTQQSNSQQIASANIANMAVQHSENQQQHLTQQSNSQQIASANIANMAVQHSENQQQHIVQQSNSQQIASANIANMAVQHSENQQQHLTQQSNSQQIASANIANMAVQHSENQQQHIVQQSNSQQIASANIANMAVQHSENQQQHIVQQSNSQQIASANIANMAVQHSENQQQHLTQQSNSQQIASANIANMAVQHSENQQQHIVQQSNSQQIASANIANMAVQHSENQQQHLTQQSNSQQIASANIANMAHSENQQQHIVQQSNSQQIPTSNQANMAMRRTKAASSIPFHLLIPILRPHLDKDRSMQLQAIFAKLRLQAQAARSAQTNTNSFSLQSQASSQQLASSVPQQITGAQSFPALHSIPSSQSLKVTGSPPNQPYVPPLTFQVQPGTSLTAPDNSTQKPREVETKSDGKGAQSVQNYTSNTNITNPERDVSMVSLQPVNKQQHHAQLPQSSFSVSGATSSYNTQAYPRPSMSSSTSIRPQNLDSHTRQVSVTSGAVSTQLRPTQSVSVINVPKYEQNPANEAKRQQVGSITASQNNPIAWQLSANKDQKGNTFPSMAVKQELVDQSSEPPNKSHFASSESTSFGSAHVNQGNHALGSSSTTGTTQISGSVPSQVDQIVQISSATPPLGGATAKTPSKKPSVGQKKLFEAPGSSPPMPSKKQKTSGTSLDQSIEQLNDVTAVSGVNLREEEEQLLSGLKEESRASEATRRIVQEEEDRLLLLKAPLQRKLSDIMLKCGLKNIGGDAERCLSMCVEERLKGLISYLIRLSKQRVDIEKSRHRFVITSDVRRQILLVNQKTKEEWDKKQAEESEKLRKVNEIDGNTGVDAEKDKEDGRPKALKANKEEDDKMRATAANVAARAAVGGDDMLSKWQLMAEQARQKREGFDGAPGKTASSKPLLSLGRSSREKQESEKKGSSAVSASGSTRRFGRKNALESHPKVARNVSLKDVIAVLEREPQMSKSSLIYRLYERLSSNSSAT
ncbi:hypothetical protein C4D60_Mb04t03340 [Musa balbisiana]|uniref:Transcription initiation factor TFIID component TAF4 C-terminal domain-containing protein n=1 Tax=Musa balbisiana TaxID=52838 RepID=A0A4S8K9B2_MUSBA|nr:hypothetical protein C4D60_Mb04t03340 [Musa balbisiana]